jgi:hypothetical protein
MAALPDSALAKALSLLSQGPQQLRGIRLSHNIEQNFPYSPVDDKSMDDYLE